MKSPFQMVRDHLGLHDKTSSGEVALVCLMMVLLLPAVGVAAIHDWLQKRRAA